MRKFPRSASSLWVYSVAVLTLFVSGCGGASAGGVSSAQATPTPSAAILSQLVIDTGPSGFTLQPDQAGDTGPSDLAKAARDDGKPDAVSTLTQDGFISGYQRLWAQPADGTYAVVYVYSFSNRGGTLSYEQRGLSLLASDPASATTQRATVAGIPGAVGFTGTSHQRTLDAVVYTKGDYLVQVAMQGPSATFAVASNLAEAQFARLP